MSRADRLGWAAAALLLSAPGLAASWVQTSYADFAAGAADGAAGVREGDGAVRLSTGADSWTSLSGPDTRDYKGLHMLPNGEAWAVGTVRGGGFYNVARYDGSAWEEDPTFGPGNALTGVWMTSPEEGWAVGDDNRMITYDRPDWFQEVHFSSDSTVPMRGVHLPDNGSGFAVGDAGTIWSFDGGAWERQASPVTDDLNAVRANAASDAWAAGAAGRLVRFDGVAWSTASSPTGNSLNALFFLSPSSGYAAGASGTLLRYAGGSWSVSDSNTGDNLFGLWMNSGADGWAVGDGGMLLYHDGDSWSERADSPTGSSLKAVSCASAERCLAVGHNGAFLKYERAYLSSGTLTSAVFDAGSGTDWGTLSWTAFLPGGTALKFQLAAADGADPADFRGPDGTVDGFYTGSGTAVWSGHDGRRYLRYRAVLTTADAAKTPLLQSVTVTHTP